MISIHNFARGVRGLRVAWLCEEMGLPYRIVTVPYPQPADYLALYPLGSVPFLTDEGGVGINESIAMLLYVAQTYGPTPLLPSADAATYARVLALTVFGETELGTGVTPLLEAHFGAPEAEKRNWSVLTREQRVEKALRYVVDALGAAPFLAGGGLSLADISVCTALGLWRGALGRALPEPLVQYRERVMARPAYQRARSRNGNG
jgi:glutathione S-transferase